MSCVYIDGMHRHDHTDLHNHEHQHNHEHHHDHTDHHDHKDNHDYEHRHDREHAHHHEHHHDHTHGMAKESLRVAFFLTCVILFASFVGGLLAHSLALVSDAAHTLTDLFALGMAWFAARQAERPSNEYKTFGYHRVGILAALLNAVTLIGIALVICWEAIQRLQHPEPVEPLIMFGSAIVAIAINLFIGFGLRKEAHDLNVRAAALHVFGDVGVSAAVIVAGVIVLATGWTFVDPLLSLAVALFLAFGTRGIVQETIHILLESVPKHISLQKLKEDVLNEVAGVKAVHDLHVWSVSSGLSALSCHVLIDDLPPSESVHILNAINALLRARYRINHATIQFEYGLNQVFCCDGSGCDCCFELSVSRQANHGHTEMSYSQLPSEEEQSSMQQHGSWIRPARVRLLPQGVR